MSTSALPTANCVPSIVFFTRRSCARVKSTIGDGFCAAGLGGCAQLTINRNRNRDHAPDFARVLRHGAIGREGTASRGVENRSTRPFVAVHPRVGGALLRLEVR